MNVESMYWVVGLFTLLELFKWLYPIACKLHDLIFKKIGVKTRRMLKREEDEKRLGNVEKAIIEIKDTSQRNVDMFLEHEDRVVQTVTNIKGEIVAEIDKLHDKVDEQQKRMDSIDAAGKQRDCAVLRDRIRGGMRYFGQTVDEQGRVHISVSDHETMQSLFDEYFLAGGNGTFKQIYENEFRKFIIDN